MVLKSSFNSVLPPNVYINHAEFLLPGDIASTRAVCMGKGRNRSSLDSNPGPLVRESDALPLYLYCNINTPMFSLFKNANIVPNGADDVIV